MRNASSRLLIRDIAPEDHEALVPLWIAAWQATMPRIDFSARAGFIAAELFRFSASPLRARLAETQDATPLGFVLVDQAAALLEQIVVADHARGLGVGDALLAEARRLSPQALHLHVNRDNSRAIAFYRRHGFRVTGEGRNPVSGLPTLSMKWSGSTPNC